MVASQQVTRVPVLARPAVRLDLHAEYFGVKKGPIRHAQFDDSHKVVAKQVGVDPLVLVLTDVVDDGGDGADLVTIQRGVDSRPAIVVAEEHRKLLGEVIGVLISQNKIN